MIPCTYLHSIYVGDMIEPIYSFIQQDFMDNDSELILYMQCQTVIFKIIYIQQCNEKLGITNIIKLEFGYQCFQCLCFWLGPTALFTTQPKTQKHVDQCIFGSHDTIHIIKNYFATVLLAINFQFQQISGIQTHPKIARKNNFCNSKCLDQTKFIYI